MKLVIQILPGRGTIKHNVFIRRKLTRVQKNFLLIRIKFLGDGDLAQVGSPGFGP